MVRGPVGLVPASWSKAVAEAARRLAGAGSPPRFVVGPSVATEDAAAVRELAERMGAGLCTSDLTGAPAAHDALRRVLPGGRGSMDVEAIAEADLLWVIAADAADSPQVAACVVEARRRGADLVRFDVHLSTADRARVVTMPADGFGELGPLLERAARHGDRAAAGAPADGSWLPPGAARALVAEFRSARRPVTIVGSRWLSSIGVEADTAALLRAIALLGGADRVVFAVGESNSWGVLDVLGPDAPAAEIACRDADLDTLVVIGDDLVRRSPRPTTMAGALSRLRSLIVVDRFPTDTTGLAHVVLPSCAFAEVDGSVTNLFGQVRPWRRIVPPPGDCQPEREWMRRIDTALGDAAASPRTARTARTSSTRTLSTRTLSTPSTPSTPSTASTDDDRPFPLLLVFSSHPASWSAGVVTGRDEILRREAAASVLAASPAVLKRAGLKPGWPARLAVAGGEATVTVMSDRRLPDEVLVLVPIPGSAPDALRGCYPGDGERTVALQPVPARLERA